MSLIKIAIELDDVELYKLAQELEKEAGALSAAGELVGSMLPKSLAQVGNQTLGEAASGVASGVKSLASKLIKSKGTVNQMALKFKPYQSGIGVMAIGRK